MCAQVAACLTGVALPAGSCAARVMLFVGGPSTEGAGKVVDKELSEPIRSHEVSPLTTAPSAVNSCPSRCEQTSVREMWLSRVMSFNVCSLTCRTLHELAHGSSTAYRQCLLLIPAG